ncbi:hypothetical protein TRFO_21032 [Tritrichomonas foetus]|uniref:Uncharacterized protein n=1 Tax=Tritrichomonas foetus TaxID=1144522 RepID=A0A1J4KKP5_9EUKA|nr:hypothetical protein TRFO_21032 [Tritrichomonas foetus]|eukprot:OHT09941.1 hypothetical protein TRFO_21032 [Tritrichomonas foetus]
MSIPEVIQFDLEYVRIPSSTIYQATFRETQKVCFVKLYAITSLAEINGNISMEVEIFKSNNIRQLPAYHSELKFQQPEVAYIVAFDRHYLDYKPITKIQNYFQDVNMIKNVISGIADLNKQLIENFNLYVPYFNEDMIFYNELAGEICVFDLPSLQPAKKKSSESCSKCDDRNGQINGQLETSHDSNHFNSNLSDDDDDDDVNDIHFNPNMSICYLIDRLMPWISGFLQNDTIPDFVSSGEREIINIYKELYNNNNVDMTHKLKRVQSDPIGLSDQFLNVDLDSSMDLINFL